MKLGDNNLNSKLIFELEDHQVKNGISITKNIRNKNYIVLYKTECSAY